MIYETKGLTLEQVDELYDEVKVARKSVGWVPTRTFVGEIERRRSSVHPGAAGMEKVHHEGVEDRESA